MGLMSRGINKLKELNRRRLEHEAEKLISKSKLLEKEFAAEAKRLGIAINSADSRSYYEALGIKFTTDQKAIRMAYQSMVKKYHPDVNKEKSAEQKTIEINGAYAVLKDKRKKEEYDSSSMKGSSKLSGEAAKEVSNAILKRYSELRNRDFKEFNERVSIPQYRDSLKAAIEETADWRRRYDRAAASALKVFIDRGNGIKRAESDGKNLLKSGIGDLQREQLRQRLLVLESMSRSFQEAEKGIATIKEKVKRELAATEDPISDKLRRSVS